MSDISSRVVNLLSFLYIFPYRENIYDILVGWISGPFCYVNKYRIEKDRKYDNIKMRLVHFSERSFYLTIFVSQLFNKITAEMFS